MPYALIINGNQITITEGNYPQLSIGLDSEKSSSPSFGNMHIATDTGKTYTCYVSGYWSIINSVAKNVYYNHSGGGDSVCGSATGGSGTADTTGHMRNLSTQIDQAGFAAYGINIPIYPSSNDFTVNFLVDGISDGSGGTGRQTNIGMTDITGEIPLISIVCDDTDQWKTYLSDGFTVQSTNISPIQNGDLITIISVRNKSIFLVNGIIVYSYSMGFSPTTSVYAIARVQCSSSITTARTVSVDFIGFELMR